MNMVKIHARYKNVQVHNIYKIQSLKTKQNKTKQNKKE